MWRGFNGHTVRDGTGLYGQAVGNFEVAPRITLANGQAPAIVETHIRDEAGSTILVRQVWPDDIVKDMVPEGVDGVGQASKSFRAWTCRQSGRVDDEAGNVVEVRMRNEIGLDETASDVSGIGAGVRRVDLEPGKGAVL